ncbi:MAG: 23S rRNA (uracil(1939)-C(5))-methyltransferase RlmD [Lachnospiraceae bacterium]|nr:23S rRNA (uracil(1939)-C(5))-methyltransferase RlmD [Lachnospiraceae bacterium]
MKKGQTYTGYVERVDFPNKGIVNAEGEKVTVKGVLPQQTVKFIASKKKSGKWEGRLLQVLQPAPYEHSREAAAVCPHSADCGGCTYQTVPYEVQLEIKKNQVKKIIDGVCKEYEFEGILPSPLTADYRNKMEFSFGDTFKDGPLALGMHKKGSFHDIVTTTDCRIVHEDFRKILAAVLEFFAERDVTFYHKMSHVGYLRHLLVRRGVHSGEITVNLVTSTQRDATQIAAEDTAFTELLRSLPLEGTIVGISHIYNDSLADVVQSDCTDILYGTDYFYEQLLGLKFKISTFSFFQTNSLGAEVLYSKAREYVGETKDKTIFDLYSGTGTIAQILAPVAKKVVGVEIVEEAVEAAKVNAAENGLSNCEFIAGDVLKVIDSIEDRPDFIVLDPPRDGIHPKALEKIIDYGVDRMVYISCKPTSLARDLVVLQERGYQVIKVCACDMFPGTPHVETVCLLSKK